MGISFPLKRRDQLLEYVLTLMGRDQSNDLNDFNTELLHTQVYAQVLTLVFVSRCRINSLFSWSFTFKLAYIYSISLYLFHFCSLCNGVATYQVLWHFFILFSKSFLHMQSLALSACTTLVSLEPRLPMETRNRVMKVCMAMLQHHKTLLIACLLLEESLYCFYLVYVPLSGNISFFCIANRALKHCWESRNKPHYSVRCHPAYKVMLWTYSSIVLFLILGNIVYYAVSFAFSFFFLCYLLCL